LIVLDIAIAHPDSPGDVRPLEAWLAGLSLATVSKIVVFGKTEGTATLNDFSRELAQVETDRAIQDAGGGPLLSRSWRLFSTGCEGIASPITIMIAKTEATSNAPEAEGLAVGAGRSDPLPPFPRCGIDHINVAAATVRQAMEDASLTAAQVRLVLIKSPVQNPGHVPPSARSGGRHSGSTGSARGAAAIGAGIALGEIDRAALSGDPVGVDSVHATRVMAFSGTETDRVEVVVLGERPGGDPSWGIASGLISDLLDADGISRIRNLTGREPDLVFFKAGIASDGRLRGRRTTILSSDLPADKQLRAAASGVVAGHFGTINAFISGGAEHQAPPGGCLCAALFRRL
jgi:cyanuric acid amidohydrolase